MTKPGPTHSSPRPAPLLLQAQQSCDEQAAEYHGM